MTSPITQRHVPRPHLPWLLTSLVLMAMASTNAASITRAQNQAGSCTATVEKIEITQGIQIDPREETTTNKAVKLIQGRAGTVRAYITSNCPGQYVTGVLEITDTGIQSRRPINGSILAAQSLQSIVRDQPNSTLNFRFSIPRGEPDRLVTFKVTPCLSVATLYSCIQMQSSGALTQFTRPLRQKLVDVVGLPIDYQFAGAPETEKGAPPREDILGLKASAMLWEVWPLPFPESRYRPAAREAEPWLTDVRDEGEQKKLLQKLDRLRKVGNSKGIGRADMLYGWFKPGALGAEPNGTNWPHIPTGIGTTNQPSARSTLAHEAGHALAEMGENLRDVIDETGWDTLRFGRADNVNKFQREKNGSPAYYDISLQGHWTVSYWVTKFTYNVMLNANPGRDVLTPEPGDIVGSILLDIDSPTDGSPWSITAGMDIATHSGPLVPEAAGDRELRVLDATGSLLYNTSISAPPFNGSAVSQFMAEVPKMSGMQSIELRKGTSTEWVMSRSNHAPEVTIISPTPGSTITDAMDVQWTAVDMDGDPLTILVEYSHDGGISRMPLEYLTAGSSFQTGVAALPGSIGTGAVYLRVSDGLNTTIAAVSGLTVGQNHSPDVAIVSPYENNELYRLGAGFELMGDVYDAEDGAPPLIRWYSSIDGFLGNGVTLTVNTVPTSNSVGDVVLSVGAHTIELRVTDTNGTTTSVFTTLVIAP